MEDFVAKRLINEYVGLLKIGEENDVDFFGRSADFNQVDYAADVVEIAIEDFALLVTADEKAVFDLHGLWGLLSLEELDNILRVARFIDKLFFFLDSADTV